MNNVGYDDSGVHKIVGRDKSLYMGIETDNRHFTEFKEAPKDISDALSRTIVERFSYKGEVKLWMYLLYGCIRLVGYDNYLKINKFIRKILKK